jgi:heat shock protein HslJ/ribosomal protein S27E
MAAERARQRAPPFIDPPGYFRHRPEATLLYALVERHYPELVAAREAAGRPLPKYVQEEFEAYLKCGRLEHGFLRVRCEDCHAEKLVAFSCKRRGFCPSCGARRMTDSAALLADDLLPEKPIRQWVLSLPLALRFLLATDPDALTRVLGIVYRTISAHVLKSARLTRASGATGAVTLIQRFGSALNLNIHFHMLVLDGAYLAGTNDARIENRRWNLIELDGRAVEPPRDRERVFFELDGANARVVGSASCNRFSGTCELVAGERLTFGPDLIATRMACGALEQERRFFDALTRAESYALTGDALLLSGPDAAPLARFRTDE